MSMTKHANGAASGARGDTIGSGVVSEYPPVNEAAVGDVKRPCPICHGSGRVAYDVISLPCAPIRCKCCKGTGRQLWERVSDNYRESRTTKERIDRRTLRKGVIEPRTLLALQSPTYGQFCQKCIEAGYQPNKVTAYYALRNEHRNRPEFVKGKTGPKPAESSAMKEEP